MSPEAAHGGTIALVRNGDIIEIDIPSRRLDLLVDAAELAARRAALMASGGFRPVDRVRPVPAALRAYAAMATSASTGAARDVCLVDRG